MWCHKTCLTLVQVMAWCRYIGSGNGLVPNGTKPLPESNFTENNISLKITN